MASTWALAGSDFGLALKARSASSADIEVIVDQGALDRGQIYKDYDLNFMGFQGMYDETYDLCVYIYIYIA